LRGEFWTPLPLAREGCKPGGKNEGASAPAAPRKPRLREECDRFDYVNDQALLDKANILKWMPALFPGGEETSGGYAIWPDAMGRDCEERISAIPAGIQDFGQDWGEGRAGYTPIGLVQAFFRKDDSGELAPVDEFDDRGAPIGGSVSREDAAAYLCDCLDIDWAAEIAKDDELAASEIEALAAETAKLYPEYLEGLEAAAPKPAAVLAATPFVLRDPTSIEPRRWLYGRHYIRGYLSATVAPGGLGKSSLVLTEATAMAAGKNLLGEQPAEKLRVWYWNGEDPLEEIERRETAACLHHEVAADDIAGCLFINSGRETEIVVARADHSGVKVAKPVVAALGRTIREHKIDLMVIDPFVASHAVPENDNGAINAVCRQWAMLAEETGCAVELVHHVRKGAAGQGEYTVDDARGAGALLAAARSVRVLNRMTADEATRAGVRNPRSFFRVDNGKANLAPPAEVSTWRQIVSVPLGNDRGATRGDSVGVVIPWTWPDRAGAITPDDVRAIQEAIAAGEWRSSTQAKEWAGNAVADVLDLDLSDPAAKASAKAILKSLIGEGSLKVVECRDDTRKLRTFVRVGEKVRHLRKSIETGDHVRSAQKTGDQMPENEVSQW
jgi:hypothetical protein